MTKEGRKKVKFNTPSSLTYVTSDENTIFNDNYDSSDDGKPFSSEPVKNPNVVSADRTWQAATPRGL
jgi:hypothetical protein